jgi:hypothetical protein
MIKFLPTNGSRLSKKELVLGGNIFQIIASIPDLWLGPILMAPMTINRMPGLSKNFFRKEKRNLVINNLLNLTHLGFEPRSVDPKLVSMTMLSRTLLELTYT